MPNTWEWLFIQPQLMQALDEDDKSDPSAVQRPIVLNYLRGKSVLCCGEAGKGRTTGSVLGILALLLSTPPKGRLPPPAPRAGEELDCCIAPRAIHVSSSWHGALEAQTRYEKLGKYIPGWTGVEGCSYMLAHGAPEPVYGGNTYLLDRPGETKIRGPAAPPTAQDKFSDGPAVVPPAALGSPTAHWSAEAMGPRRADVQCEVACCVASSVIEHLERGSLRGDGVLYVVVDGVAGEGFDLPRLKQLLGRPLVQWCVLDNEEVPFAWMEVLQGADLFEVPRRSSEGMASLTSQLGNLGAPLVTVTEDG